LFAVPGAIPLWDPSWLVQAAPAWSASTVEVVGNLLLDSNGNTQKCTTAGTTGTSAPNWARSLNATTTDGTVTWTLIALGAAAGQMCIDANGNIQQATAITLPVWVLTTAYVSGNLIVDSNGNTQRCTTAGTSGGAPPVWATTLGTASPVDGTVTWTLVAIGKAAVSKLTAPTWATTVGLTTADTIATATGTITWTLIALGPIPNLQMPVLISGSNPNSLAPGQAGIFGPMIQGFTIPYALNQIFQQNAGQAIVVNVFDQHLHFTTITAGVFAFPAAGIQAINVGHMGLSTIKITNSGVTVTYVEGADFSVDRVNGVVTALTGSLMTTGQSLKITCNYADPSKLADSDLVGTVTANVYTGMQNWKLAYGLMGFFPKLLIAPSFGNYVAIGQTVGSQDATVASGMATLAAVLRAVYFIDCPAGTSPATMLSNRGASGNSWNTADFRAILCGPEVLFADGGINPIGVSINPATGAAIQNPANTNHAGPFSPYVAGAQSYKDAQLGYWWGPSNTQVNGVLGPDVAIYSSIIDSSNDSNTLNSQGIVTTFQAFGTGYRIWGNRSASFPIYTIPQNFISVRRIMDGIEQSVQFSMMQFLDQPITNGLIASILASIDSFLKTLVGRGALIGTPTVVFNPVDNPPAQIANGQLVFAIDCMPAIPAERLTFNVMVDTSQLVQLTGAAQTA